MALDIRAATPADVPQMVELIQIKRQEYQTYQPVFWKTVSNAAELTAPYFTMMVSEPSWSVIVAMDGAEMAGFISAREVPVPPVYDGVPSCLVDDFTVRNGNDWASVGQRLLDHFKTEARSRNWRQVIVICGDLDEPKAAMLKAAGLSIASNWWTMRLPE